MVELAGGGFVAVAVGFDVAVAVDFIGIGATIRTHQEIQWFLICIFCRLPELNGEIVKNHNIKLNSQDEFPLFCIDVLLILS